MRQNFVTYFGDDDSTNIIRNNFNVNEAKYLKKNINTTNRIPILLCTNRKKNTIITKTNYLQDVLFFT